MLRNKKWEEECTKLTVHRQIQLSEIFEKYGSDKIPFYHFTKERIHDSSIRNSEVYPIVCAYFAGILKLANDGLVKPKDLKLGVSVGTQK